MTRRVLLTCAVCGEPVAPTKHGLMHVSPKARAHTHQPVVTETAEQVAKHAQG